MQSVPFFVALALGSASLGYFLGRGAVPSATPAAVDYKHANEPASENPRVNEDRGDSDESDAEADGDLDRIQPEPAEECKLVLVVRSDLDMSTGKVAAQCAHATLACYKALSRTNPSLLRHWERTGQTKVALRCDSEDEMLLLQAQAQSLNICARSIQDAGRTQIAAGSRTVLGIGPAPVRLVNQITGMLRLL
ncbi:PTH2-domain-containing protein [Russula ochroleuca]|uniref:peptidyl-tRNA hydrolase n=1 Tax=Russula ochroleuca TaxID=152965 RepID=A0A9P5MX27_9AGAM|nr:PTH2-domain-containing protein [Russula ochroleuca]